ncbi:hypothetical protein DBR42_25025 [Pelomonas sp. HMWF004]|nr:hypothetical protein DBR42_25025 [Pelomonas sp. HMWF004]
MNTVTYTVNDYFDWLNQNLGLHIPMLPLTGFPPEAVALWGWTVTGWVPGSPYEQVSVDNSYFIPTAGHGITLGPFTLNVTSPPSAAH